jgi:hypothetical protein
LLPLSLDSVNLITTAEKVELNGAEIVVDEAVVQREESHQQDKVPQGSQRLQRMRFIYSIDYFTRTLESPRKGRGTDQIGKAAIRGKCLRTSSRKGMEKLLS